MITSFQSIPCVLENSINSQHPGQAVCIVEQNVYSYHGFRHRYVLIPGGSKFQGSYTPLAKQGDTRLSILWQRLLKPDGSMLMLPDGLPTQDAMGRTSLPGEIDNRMWEQFGTPILLTALTALASELVPQGTEGLSGAEQILVEGESRIVTQMLSNNLDLKPIMTIPTGSRLTVKPTIDLIFEPTRIRVLGSSSGVKQQSVGGRSGVVIRSAVTGSTTNNALNTYRRGKSKRPASRHGGMSCRVSLLLRSWGWLCSPRRSRLRKVCQRC
jgi:type IV secretion system protein VirB10